MPNTIPKVLTQWIYLTKGKFQQTSFFFFFQFVFYGVIYLNLIDLVFVFFNFNFQHCNYFYLLFMKLFLFYDLDFRFNKLALVDSSDKQNRLKIKNMKIVFYREEISM
jgi:hypothetical protein